MRQTLHATIGYLCHRLTRTQRGADRMPARKGFRPSLDVASRALRDTDAELLGRPTDAPTTAHILNGFDR